jgi:hypothetical protein
MHLRSLLHGAFLKLDASTVQPSDLPLPKVDVVTCSLGYSVVPNWEEAFRGTLNLLGENGVYVIFDQYEEGLLVPDFASDQTRRAGRLFSRAVSSRVRPIGSAIGSSRLEEVRSARMRRLELTKGQS